MHGIVWYWLVVLITYSFSAFLTMLFLCMHARTQYQFNFTCVCACGVVKPSYTVVSVLLLFILSLLNVPISAPFSFTMQSSQPACLYAHTHIQQFQPTQLNSLFFVHITCLFVSQPLSRHPIKLSIHSNIVAINSGIQPVALTWTIPSAALTWTI